LKQERRDCQHLACFSIIPSGYSFILAYIFFNKK
jgi:hypothetical protein